MLRELVLASVLSLAAAVPANAATFIFDFDTNIGSGSGTFTTVGDGSTPTQVTSLTGSFGGNVMSLLAPGTYPGQAPNDNLFTFSSPFFTFNGLSFSAGGNLYNIYGQGGTVRFCGVTTGCAIRTVSRFEVAAGAVPEPSTWALLMIGFGAIGAAIRYRRRGVRATSLRRVSSVG